MNEREMIRICQTALDFDAPMITTLADEAEISKQEAEIFIGKHLEQIYS